VKEANGEVVLKEDGAVLGPELWIRQDIRPAADD